MRTNAQTVLNEQQLAAKLQAMDAQDQAYYYNAFLEMIEPSAALWQEAAKQAQNGESSPGDFRAAFFARLEAQTESRKAELVEAFLEDLADAEIWDRKLESRESVRALERNSERIEKHIQNETIKPLYKNLRRK